MAKGSAVTDELINIVLIAGLIYGAKWLVDSGSLEQVLQKLQDAGKNLKLPNFNLGGPSRGGGGGLIYKGTGRVMTARQEGPKVRHYASGKPNDTTIEWNVDNCPFSAYEFDADVLVTKIDHDDEISMKMFGPQHQDGKGAWYINNITFKSGTVKGGWEQPHPNTTSGCVKGPSVGSVINKTTHVKSVIWPISGGAHIEFYVNGQRVLSGSNWCGKKFSRDSNQQVQLRIDAAPGVKATNVRVSEISV